MSDIRKISVGKDYPDGVLHYQKGKTVNLGGNPYTVSDIVIDNELKAAGKVAYNIYIANHDGVVLWKQVIDVPVLVEFNIWFD